MNSIVCAIYFGRRRRAKGKKLISIVVAARDSESTTTTRTKKNKNENKKRKADIDEPTRVRVRVHERCGRELDLCALLNILAGSTRRASRCAGGQTLAEWSRAARADEQSARATHRPARRPSVIISDGGGQRVITAFMQAAASGGLLVHRYYHYHFTVTCASSSLSLNLWPPGRAASWTSGPHLAGQRARAKVHLCVSRCARRSFTRNERRA